MVDDPSKAVALDVRQDLFPGVWLTPRQVQIVEKLLEAKSNKQIALELKLSLGTVKEYIYHLYAKLRVSSRLELVVKAKGGMI